MGLARRVGPRDDIGSSEIVLEQSSPDPSLASTQSPLDVFDRQLTRRSDLDPAAGSHGDLQCPTIAPHELVAGSDLAERDLASTSRDRLAFRHGRRTRAMSRHVSITWSTTSNPISEQCAPAHANNSSSIAVRIRFC